MYKNLNMQTITVDKVVTRKFEIEKKDILDNDVLEQLFIVLDIFYNALLIENPYKKKSDLFNYLEKFNGSIVFEFISGTIGNQIKIY